MKTITVPGLGDVDFPDEMSDQDISSAIRTKIIPQHAASRPPSENVPGRDPGLTAAINWSAHMADMPGPFRGPTPADGQYWTDAHPAPQVTPRPPTPAEAAMPALGYQQPVDNLLNPAPRHGMGGYPAMKDAQAFDASQPAGMAPQDPAAAQAAMAQERQQNLQSYAEGLPLSDEERNIAAAKGAAGATPGIPQPNLTGREEATGFQHLGAAIPATLLMGAGGLAIPAMAAYSGLEALKQGGGVDQATGVPADPVQVGVQAAIGTVLGATAGMRGIPGAVSRVAAMGGLPAVQAVVENQIRQHAQAGHLSPQDAQNPDVVKQVAIALVQGLLGAQGVPHGAHPAEPGAASPTEPGRTPISSEMIDAGVYGHGDGEGGFKFHPPQQGPQPAAPGQAPSAVVPESPPIAPRERGIFEAAPTPEDMQGRQFAAGTAAQTALREAQAARDPLAQAHEEALRASVEAENALRSRFPDEGVSPKYPAERDLLRALTTQHQAAEAKAADARTSLDEANATLAEAQRKASQAQPTALPDMPMDRLRGRQEAIKAMQEAGLPPEHVQRAVETMDKRPEIYELGSKAVDLSPEVLKELGVGENVSRETPLLQPSEINQKASESYRKMVDMMQPEPSGAPEGDLGNARSHEHQLSFELDFGEGSPLATKYPDFASMPYEKKAQVTKAVLDPVVKMAQQISGVKQGVRFYGPGGWGEFPVQPSGQVRVDAPIEKVRAMADAIGYLANQTGVYISRPHAEGTKLGLDIRGPGLESPEKAQAFWEALRASAPDIATGFHPIEGGIRIGREESPAQAEALNAQFGPAIDAVAKKMGLTLDHDFVPLEAELRTNNWKENPDGREYLQRIGETLGPEVSGRLERIYRPGAHAIIEKQLGQKEPALLQEHDPAHGRSVGDQSRELARRFGIDHEALAANTPEAAKSVYKALGNETVDRNTGPELKIYPLHDIPPEKMAQWLAAEGWNYKIFGPDQATGKFIPPNFKEFSYDNKHAWIFSPWTEHGSFRDTEYTRTWRVTHEIAHGQTNESLTSRYGGIGKRQGALGRSTVFNGRDTPPLSLADALRAVEWEHETFQRQREILEKDFGVKITDEQFRKENAINMSDAVYRVLTGDFSNPGENGLLPKAANPDQVLAQAKSILRAAARDMSLDMAEKFSVVSLSQDNGDIKGAFLPSTAEKKGMVYLVKGKADLSTVLHEYLGHGMEEKVLRAPENKALLTEAETLITKDIGAEAVKDGWTREAKEWFARKVEQYFYEGNTDVPTLKPLFEKIRNYMQQIYAALKGGPMGKSITPEERAFFDKVFGKGEPTPREQGRDPLASSTKPQVSVRPESKPEAPPRQAIPAAAEKTPHVPGERSLPKTLESHGIEGGTDKEYDVKHLDESAQAAIAEIKSKGAESVQQDILGRPKFDPQDMPRAIALMRQWQHEADNLPPGPDKVTALAKTVQMASEMSRRATEAGQFNAMIRILERLSPDGVVYYAQKQIEKANVNRAPSRQLKMQPETATVLREAAKEIKANTDLAEDAAPLAKAAGKMEKGETLSADDLEALKAFRRRLGTYLGERPPERPKGILGRPKAQPKPTAAPAAAKAPADNVEAILSAREAAALSRLKGRGLQPTKALLQTTKTLAEEDVSDLADVFASRLAQRKGSVSAIRQNFVESFGPEIAPYLDEIAQKGARRLQETRRERVKMTDLSKRVDEILDPLLKGQPADMHQAEQLRAAFDALKELTGDAKREAGWDLQEALNSMVPAGFGKKAAAVLFIDQLFGPKSAIRNVAGNELFFRTERMSKWVAANGIDWARSKLTGTDRLITFRTAGQGDYWKNFFLGSKAAIRGVNPEGLESKYDLGGYAFKNNKIGDSMQNRVVGTAANLITNPFYWAERALGITMRATDHAAYKRAFNQTLGEMAELSADRKKIPSGQREAYIKKWMETAPPEVMEIAEAYGKYATFQDPTALATGAAGLKKFLNAGQDFGLGNFIINYPKTPANILMRAIEYSPAGVLKSLYLLSEPWRTGMPRNTRELEMSLGRVLVGGAGGAIAYFLAKHGVLSGQKDKDTDLRNFKKEHTGEGNYQVNVSAIGRWLAAGLKPNQLNKRDGDTLVSYDWAQPLAINAAMVATAVQALSDKKHPIRGALAGVEAGLDASTGTLEEQPLLSGLKQLFGGNKPLPERLMDVAEGIPASFAPTLLNQIRQLKDNTARSTAAPNVAARMVNRIMYRLPMVSEFLPVAYKSFGKSEPRETYQNGSNTLFNVFLNPAFVSKYHVDPQIAIILNPYEQEGRQNQFPKVLTSKDLALKYSDHKGPKVYNLSGAELSELQRRLAQETYRRFQGMKLEDLKGKSPEVQERVMAKGVNESWNQIRREFLREKGIRVK